jgi:predicted glycoside hydrolase/deacetylase ChbG (UPF0249 family)
MVFMADSVRAAAVAKDLKIDVGLHLNLSERFSDPSVGDDIRKAHDSVRSFLMRSRYSLIVYNPFLRSQFFQVVRAQIQAFERLFEHPPSHVDGHQHMHLCTNALFDNLLPTGAKVRRSFSFRRGEKTILNRAYRAVVDQRLAQRHRLTDYFFALASNLSTERLRKVFDLSRTGAVELMCHPEVVEEHNVLMSDDFRELIATVPCGSYASL